PIAAYVKNLSANGNYYWVFAFAFPIEDGYLSIRFKPSSDIFKLVQSVYAEILDYEKKTSMDEAETLLLEKIKSVGFPDYETFMIHAALEELKARSQKVLEQTVKKNIAQERVPSTTGVGQITEVVNGTSLQLDDMFERVQTFQKSNQIFSATIESMKKGIFNLKFISLNMTIAASRFGEVAQSLGVVSKEFAGLSEKIEALLNGLSGFTKTLSEVIQQCTLQITALNLQMHMVEFFVKESLAKANSNSEFSANAFAELNENRVGFSKLFHDYTKSLNEQVCTMRSRLVTLDEQMAEAQKYVTGLEVIRQVGTIESARIDEIKKAFVHYLEEMNAFIKLVKDANVSIHGEVNSLEANSKVIMNSTATLEGRVELIFSLSSATEQKKDKPLPTLSAD
ncbi:MAG TPA: hypothetical protein VN132_06460, partial [Bdellovibrio sp.]|nr:hypothetical protein [Bdellovibrio sp.]